MHCCCTYGISCCRSNCSIRGYTYGGKYYGTMTALISAIREDLQPKTPCENTAHSRCYHTSNKCCGKHDGCQDNLIKTIPMDLHIHGDSAADIRSKALTKASVFFGVSRDRIELVPAYKNMKIHPSYSPDKGEYSCSLTAKVKN